MRVITELFLSRPDRIEYFVGVGVTLRSLLRVHQVAVHNHLISTTPRRDDLQIRDLLFELFEQAFRQTDGSRCIASLSAVFDRYLHGPILFAVLVYVPHSCIPESKRLEA